MGEGFISRRGGEAYKLPILNASYPKDVTAIASATGTASFSIAISEHGKPEAYSYQWYVNGKAVSGAVTSNYTTDLKTVGTKTIYCIVTNKAGSVTSRAATLTIKDSQPVGYKYDGAHNLVQQDDYNWYIEFTTSGKLTLPRDMKIDVNVVGAGGGGGHGSGQVGGGGGGGWQTVEYGIDATAGTEYQIVIGAGGGAGYGAGGGGGQSSAFNVTAAGGKGGAEGHESQHFSAGGEGGTGNGGSSGNGTPGSNTVRAFGETSEIWPIYGGGGASGNNKAVGGTPYGGDRDQNAKGPGGGGGGGPRAPEEPYFNPGGAGGSGIVLIRNAR